MRRTGSIKYKTEEPSPAELQVCYSIAFWTMGLANERRSKPYREVAASVLDEFFESVEQAISHG